MITGTYNTLNPAMGLKTDSSLVTCNKNTLNTAIGFTANIADVDISLG